MAGGVNLDDLATESDVQVAQQVVAFSTTDREVLAEASMGRERERKREREREREREKERKNMAYKSERD